MALLAFRLGNGRYGIVDADTCQRILNEALYDTEELRKDTPLALQSSYSYSGLALSGSATSSPVWNVVRFTYDANGAESRIQYLPSITWDGRAAAAWPA